MTAALAAIIGLSFAAPAQANFRSAKANFAAFSDQQQTEITLGLIATGDFDGLVDFGFTSRLYDAIRSFERREGGTADGSLDAGELRTLNSLSQAFYARLGNKYYLHPVTGTKLLVPRKLFDSERRTDNGLIFTREDQNLSLSFVSFPVSQKSFTGLYATMTSRTPDREISYKRLFHSHFVVTGTFRGQKFYTWISALPEDSSGFTVSWSEAWNSTGRRVSALLANSFLER